MRTVLFILVSAILAGCSSGPYPVSSSYYMIPAGSKLVLQQELTILPHSARVYIQYGKVVSPKQKDDFYAHCWFQSWRVMDSAQVIKPDTFTITHSSKYDDVVLRQPATKLALQKTAFVMNNSFDGGPMALEYTTEMQIHSDSQPDIRRFVCSHWEEPDALGKHLTVAEMQKALGSIATLKLAGGK